MQDQCSSCNISKEITMAERKKIRKKGTGIDVKDREKEKHKLQPPKKYKVVFHNDDYTPMDFVTIVIMDVFHKSKAAADTITLMVHHSGKGIVGTYPKEVAEMKLKNCHEWIRAYQHPLLVTLEQE